MKADAVVFTAINTVQFTTIDCPDPGPDDAVVRVTHSWISNGTEGSYLRGERVNGDTPWRPGDPEPFPIVAGYQKIGVVEKVGAAISDLSVGETVFCVAGRVNGMFKPWGGHVSPSVSPRDVIYKLPPDVDPLACAGLVLTQVGYNCGTRAPVERGEWAIVFGDGMVGNWAAQTLAWRGAKVIVVGRHEHRLSLARELAKAITVNTNDNDWIDAIPESGVAEHVAVAVDTVGSPDMTEKIINLLRPGGHIVSAGFCRGEDRVSLQSLRDREISLDSVSGLTRPRMERTLELIAEGNFKTLPLITHRFPARSAADAWRLIQDRREPVLGVILDW